MNKLEDCFRIKKNFPNLSKANSAVCNGRVIYIIKEDHAGKSSDFFFAYDYETKIQLHFHEDKDKLIEFLNEQNFEVLK